MRADEDVVLSYRRRPTQCRASVVTGEFAICELKVQRRDRDESSKVRRGRVVGNLQDLVCVRWRFRRRVRRDGLYAA